MTIPSVIKNFNDFFTHSRDGVERGIIKIKKQQINRYEEHDYQNVSIIRISEILSVLGLSLSLENIGDMAA